VFPCIVAGNVLVERSIQDMLIIYALIFLVTAFWSDFANLIAFSIGPINVYPIDFIGFFGSLFVIARWKTVKKRLKIPLAIPVLALLLWLVISIIRGVPSYSVSAFGDGRIVLPFFLFLVPLALHEPANQDKVPLRQVEITLLVSAIAVLIMFVVELLVGHRVGIFLLNSPEMAYGDLSDARGVRLLGTDQTFSAGVYLVFILVSSFFAGGMGKARIAIGFLLMVAIFMSQNRTATVTLVAATACYGIFFAKHGKRFQIAIWLLLLFVIATIIIALVAPESLESAQQLLHAGFNPDQDPTGTWAWRLTVAGSAIEQFLENPILGQGFGGHWQLFTESDLVTAPPHNQYLTLMVKSGTIGVLCLIWVLIATIYVFITRRKSIELHARPLLDTMFVVVIASIPYGFAYDYVPLFGFYLGIFYSIVATCSHGRAVGPSSPDEPTLNTGSPDR
jgi:O-Antigen ligase